MRAERFRQIRNLFDAALERPSDARHAYVREACQGDEELLVEVGRLLAAHGEPTAWIDAAMLGQSRPRLEGRQVGAYEILRQLGEGGMGTVYLAARSDDTDRAPVALKIVRPESLTDEVLRRFKREREILEALDHPNIARVLDGGTTEDGIPYLVMDYVDGQPIDAYCDSQHLDLNARLNLFRDVCEAVHYAHARRIVHRDLKPANILVTSSGVVKLLDFGISKLAVGGPEGPTCLTRSDLLLMTPEYASPEQVSGLAVTPASDVYALGVILYELLTGRRPYRLKSRILREIVRVICDEPPTRPSTLVAQRAEDGAATIETIGKDRAASPAELKRLLSGNIDAILLKTLEKDPAQRYRSARQLSEELSLHLQGQTIEARRHQVMDAAGRFFSASLWPLTLMAALGLLVYTGVLVIPREVLTSLAAIGMLLVGAYPLAVYALGREATRRTYRNLARIVPGAAVAGGVAVWLMRMSDVPGNPRASIRLLILLSLIPFLVIFVWCANVLSRWRGRERLGPVVLELSPRSNRKFLWVFAMSQLALGLMFGWMAWKKREPALLVIILFMVPLHTVIYVTRPEIRQCGFLGRPWTDVISYSWESGAGKLGENAFILHLRFRTFWGPRTAEIGILREHRERIQSLLEQQLSEWPS